MSNMLCKKVKSALAILLSVTAATSFAEKPNFVMPAGDAMASANRIIFKEAEQRCGKVVSAEKADSKFIVAKCSNGETYLVSIMKNAPMKDGTRKDVPIAGKCSALEKFIGYKVQGCN